MSVATPYLPKGYHLVMVLPDLHVPYQDEVALSCVLKAHDFLKPKRTIILGDWLDAEPFKTFDNKNLKTKSCDFKKDEIDPCNRIIDTLQKNTKLLVYLEGNHEVRIERTAANAKNKSLASVYSLISPKNLLSDGRKNFIWVPYNKELSHYKVTPDLWAFHGWSHSKHVAETHLNYLMSVSAVFGHVHRQQSAVRRNKVTDKIIKAWTPGCLCARQPIWATATPTDWVHGFSIIYVKNDNSSWFDYTINIEGGQCILPGGKLIKG
jgi:predicted phosphodiesterase